MTRSVRRSGHRSPRDAGFTPRLGTSFRILPQFPRSLVAAGCDLWTCLARTITPSRLRRQLRLMRTISRAADATRRFCLRHPTAQFLKVRRSLQNTTTLQEASFAVARTRGSKIRPNKRPRKALKHAVQSDQQRFQNPGAIRDQRRHRLVFSVLFVSRC